MSVPIALAIASFVATAGSAVMQYQAQSAQAEAQNRAVEANALAARRAAFDNYGALNERAVQEGRTFVSERFEATRAEARATATAAAAAGEAGVSGLSVDRLLADYYGITGRNANSAETQLEFTLQQLAREATGVQSSAENRINAMPRAQAPSVLGTGLQIIGAGVGAYTSYQRMIDPTPRLKRA